MVGQVLLGLPPLIQKIILDDAVLAHRRPLLPWLAALAGVGVGGAVLHYQRRYLASRTSLELMHRLRVAIQRHLHTLDVASQEQLSTGDVMARATGDVTLVQAFVFQIPLMVANATLFVTAVAVMLCLSPLLSLVIAVFAPLFVLFSVRFRDHVFPSSFNDQLAAGALAGVVEEAVAGVRVVKAFGQEQQELSLFLDRARDLFRSRLRTARLTAHYSATLQALPTFAQLAVLAVGGLLTLRDNISLGVFLAFCSYVVQLLAPLRQLSNMLANSQQGRVGAERVLELLSRQALVKDSPKALRIDEASGQLRLERVSFGYPGKAAILHDLSLDIAPGARLGIVGSSGSGKTTLALLLARFYDTTGGVIRLDGHDVRDIALDSLRKNVCVVFEESFLFSMSVRENIAFARPDASFEEIEAAARAAQAHDFITELPQGYEARVGERGTLLSGGQRQRVALARAFLANPKVLILDDATSALDANTEEAIHRSLEQQMHGRTTIIIAHRQSTLRLATRAIALDGGRIAVDGKPQELLETSSLYRRLLTGPELTDEPTEQVHEPRAVDPRAWPQGVVRTGAARAMSLDTQLSQAASRGGPGGGGGGFGGGGGGNRAAHMTATPELLERIARLPPLNDEPEVDLAAQVTPARSTLQLRDLVEPFTRSLVAGLVLLSIDALTSLAAPLLIGRAVDGAILTRNAAALGYIVLALLVVQVVSWLNARAMQLQTARTAERMLFALRARAFAHLQRL
ncbi:MAG TPA: ABC transporter transmembrane domain-containing protein, partial [Polyangiaceae bacterium]|nr:ABC transporter transmembrane domain-containing protein [Polyangiaceae bacterium]